MAKAPQKATEEGSEEGTDAASSRVDEGARRRVQEDGEGQHTHSPHRLHLDRTESAVRNKAREMGLSLKPTNKSPYGTKAK